MATYTFEPPKAAIVPPYEADTRGLQWLLFRYTKPRYQGVNVYVLSDGTIAQSYPTPENQNTNYPLPYNPQYPDAPYAYWSNPYAAGGQTNNSTSLPVHISKIYLGGHIYTISEKEATRLSDYGYADCITITT